MGYFENYEESRERTFVENPIHRTLMALGLGLFIFLWFFVLLPSNSRSLEEKSQKEGEKHEHIFRKLAFEGVAFRKRPWNRHIGYAVLTLQDSQKDTFEIAIKSKASYRVYDAIELGDTVEKLPDTLLTIIRNYPKRLIR